MTGATTGTGGDGDPLVDYDYEISGFEQEYGLFVIGQCPSGPDSCFGE
jgi:hypothetical protein